MFFKLIPEPERIQGITATSFCFDQRFYTKFFKDSYVHLCLIGSGKVLTPNKYGYFTLLHRCCYLFVSKDITGFFDILCHAFVCIRCKTGFDKICSCCCENINYRNIGWTTFRTIPAISTLEHFISNILRGFEIACEYAIGENGFSSCWISFPTSDFKNRASFKTVGTPYANIQFIFPWF